VHAAVGLHAIEAGVPALGLRGILGTFTPPAGMVWLPATNLSVSVSMACASTVSTLMGTIEPCR